MSVDDTENKANRKLTAAFETAAIMEVLDPKAVTIASSAVIETASLDQDDALIKKQSVIDWFLQNQIIDDYLKMLDRLIEELEERIALLRVEYALLKVEALAAFDQMHGYQDLLKDIGDGISAEERQRLIDVYGEKAKDATAEELAIMLQADIDRAHQIGINKDEKADKVKQALEEEEERYRQIVEQRSNYENARSQEQQDAVQQKVSEILADDEQTTQVPENQNAQRDVELIDKPDFLTSNF